MMLNTKSRYAVMAMVDMAQNTDNTPVTLAELAERQEIPLAYLEQIFAHLRRGGLVQSRRGPGGGYLLAKPLAETWVSDIVTAVDEPLQMTRCGSHHKKGCMSDKARCLTHDLWEGLENQIHDYLSSVSLDDVVNRQVQSVKAAGGLNGGAGPLNGNVNNNNNQAGEGNPYV